MRSVTDDVPLPVHAARAGDADAWDRLFRRYQLPLYTYIFELIKDEQASLDIVQETFINAVRYIDTLRLDEKFGSWLFGIAHQKCAQFWRRNARAHPLLSHNTDVLGGDGLSDEIPTEGDNPIDLLISKEEEQEFMQRLAELPSAHRSVLLLHFLEDFSLQEIAVINNVALGTVKSRLHYAKKALRRSLEEKSV
jgi:RNA polymerase sigma-70 factor (ECF subfamily)